MGILGVIAIVGFFVFLLSGIRIVQPTYRGVIERLGKYNRFLNVGFNWIIPVIESAKYRNITERMTNIASQEIITKDNLNAKVGDVKTQTDKMNFTGTDIKATLDGETVTASSVTDKTGYSLSVTPPTAADIKTAIEAGGSSLALIKAKTDNLPASPAAVGSNMGTVTGVSGNVTGSVGSVTAGVTVTTNNDKTGYTASTVSDKTGYALTSAYDPAKTAAQAGNAMTLTAAYDASKTAAQASTALSTAVWTSQKAGYLDAAISGIAASAVNLSIDGTKTSTIEADGHQITVG